MVQSNKVLTVSYGTFSCTLEGFDDSFDTMKAIAEYFRDLAADDRYFGAEPPQPDAEMLARIAEREVARQVEARREASGIVLRATGAPEPIESAPVPRQAETPVASEFAVIEPNDTVSDTVAPADIPSREEAAQQEPGPALAAEPAAPTEEDVADEAAPVIVAEDIALEKPAAPAAPVADSIAAKLARIRAVVSSNEASEEDDYSEDEHAEPLSAETTDDIIHILQEEEASDAGIPDEAPEDAEPETGDTASEMIEPVEQDVPTWETYAGLAAPTEQPASDEAETSAHDDSDAQAAPEDDEDEFVEVALEGEDSLFGDLDQDDDEDGGFSDDLRNILKSRAGDDAQSDESSAPAIGRVIKIKKSELEAAIAAGDLEEVEDEDDGAPAEAAADSLSPQDEADLMRELAEVEAEIHTEDEDTPSQDRKIGGSESDVDRLMDAADQRLNAPEAAASHETYSHMRAAVATTKAERQAGGTMGTHTSDDPYRVDLAEVVRPRRPEPQHDRSQRPMTETRPAPLKLVAEQRVDVETGSAASGPIRPRRVSTQVMDEGSMPSASAGGEGFAEFAAEMGAVELPELLEAAAAYMSFVEGRDQFSRPQLMNTVRQAGSGKVNREDGLRSFGQLLREGKIEKKGGGQFTVSGDIGYRPGKRAAG